ncbi:MAG: hypothetical protein RL662_828 [Bacteroidota bacterium]|jgi:hypothetical protein
MKKLLIENKKDFIFKASAIVILVSAIVHLFNPVVASYTMILGVIGYTITTFMSPYPGKSTRGKRLYNIQVFGIVFMIMGSYLMFVGRNEWVITMLVAAILTLYASYLLPKVYEEETRKK